MSNPPDFEADLMPFAPIYWQIRVGRGFFNA
jgi:hypothetical protein